MADMTIVPLHEMAAASASSSQQEQGNCSGQNPENGNEAETGTIEENQARDEHTIDPPQSSTSSGAKQPSGENDKWTNAYVVLTGCVGLAFAGASLALQYKANSISALAYQEQIWKDCHDRQDMESLPQCLNLSATPFSSIRSRDSIWFDLQDDDDQSVPDLTYTDTLIEIRSPVHTNSPQILGHSHDSAGWRSLESDRGSDFNQRFCNKQIAACICSPAYSMIKAEPLTFDWSTQSESSLKDGRKGLAPTFSKMHGTLNAILRSWHKWIKIFFANVFMGLVFIHLMMFWTVKQEVASNQHWKSRWSKQTSAVMLLIFGVSCGLSVGVGIRTRLTGDLACGAVLLLLFTLFCIFEPAIQQLRRTMITEVDEAQETNLRIDTTSIVMLSWEYLSLKWLRPERKLNIKNGAEKAKTNATSQPTVL